ncbi:MAG: hypothetical protein P4M12_06145 [Gammaproteobacteria bacterium]|nr:hypothetical protein [Gammaproteobacteria bacterium]
MGKKIVLPQTEDEHSSSSAGLKIDAKAKQFIDKEIKRKAQEKEEKEEKETKKREHIVENEINKIDSHAKDERRHREEYLEQQAAPSEKDAVVAPTSKKLIDKVNIKKRVEAQQQQTLETSIAEEKITKSNDFTNVYLDPATAGEIKYTSAEFLKVRAWLGGAAPINRTLLGQNKPALTTHQMTPDPEATPVEPPKPVEKFTLSTLNTFNKAQQKANATGPKTLVEQIKETWQPVPPNKTRGR